MLANKLDVNMIPTYLMYHKNHAQNLDHGNYSYVLFFLFFPDNGMSRQFTRTSINRVLKLKTERTSSEPNVFGMLVGEFMRIMLKSSYPCFLSERLYSKESLLWGAFSVSIIWFVMLSGISLRGMITFTSII